MTRIAIMVAVAALGCQRTSKLFCEHHPEMCTDGSVEGQMCGMCIAPKSACDPDTNTCVACNTSLDCDGAKPVCDQHDCRACEDHSECASGACLPDGSCAPVGTVAFVEEGATDNPACSAVLPCGHIQAALDTMQPNIKVTGTIDENLPTLDSITRVIVGAPNARLTSAASVGSILDVAGTSTITVGRITICGALTPNVGVTLNGGILTLDHVTIDQCANGAISVASGKLILHQSIVSNNLNGGILINGGASTFDISNNFVFRNGQTSSGTVGGIDVASFANDGTNKLEFNTIVDNHIATATAHAGGITCDINGFSTANNIVARNDVNGDRAVANANVVGVCNYLTTYNNENITPLDFVRPDNAPFDYHIQPGSAAIDMGTTTTTIDYDFDGNHRPAHAANDQGANEVQ